MRHGERYRAKDFYNKFLLHGGSAGGYEYTIGILEQVRLKFGLLPMVAGGWCYLWRYWELMEFRWKVVPASGCSVGHK